MNKKILFKEKDISKHYNDGILINGSKINNLIIIKSL